MITHLWLGLMVVALLFGALFLFGLAQAPPDPIRVLKDRFIVLSRLARPEAESELLDRVEALAERFPGKSYVWYLEWLVTDLERAKR
ncbi:MAG: hypothetical protein U0228_21020 [Myxococcaceae bacterium]